MTWTSCSRARGALRPLWTKSGKRRPGPLPRSSRRVSATAFRAIPRFPGIVLIGFGFGLIPKPTEPETWSSGGTYPEQQFESTFT